MVYSCTHRLRVVSCRKASFVCTAQTPGQGTNRQSANRSAVGGPLRNLRTIRSGDGFQAGFVASGVVASDSSEGLPKRLNQSRAFCHIAHRSSLEAEQTESRFTEDVVRVRVTSHRTKKVTSITQEPAWQCNVKPGRIYLSPGTSNQNFGTNSPLTMHIPHTIRRGFFFFSLLIIGTKLSSCLICCTPTLRLSCGPEFVACLPVSALD